MFTFVLAFPFAFLALAFLTLSLATFHLPTVHRRCRRNFSVSVSSPARERVRLGEFLGLPRARLSRDHGGLLVRVPSQLLPKPLVKDLRLQQFLHWATPFSQDASMSPQSHAVHLLPSCTWVEDATQEHCHSMSTFPLVLVCEHSPRFESVTSRNQGNQREVYPRTLMRKA